MIAGCLEIFVNPSTFQMCCVTTTILSLIMYTLYPLVSSLLRSPKDLFLELARILHLAPKTTMSLKIGGLRVKNSLGETLCGLALLGLLFKIYRAPVQNVCGITGSIPQKLKGSPQSKTILRTIVIIVRCIRSALPLLTWFFASLTWRADPIFWQKTSNVLYSPPPSVRNT